jgi:hypothetical protein
MDWREMKMRRRGRTRRWRVGVGAMMMRARVGAIWRSKPRERRHLRQGTDVARGCGFEYS